MSVRISILFVLLLTFCQPVGAVTLKIATAAPEGSVWMQDMRAGAEEIGLRSKGRVRIKFFAGGVMGNDKSVMRKIRIGQLHGGAFIAGSLEAVSNNVNIMSLPMIFRSYEEVDYVRKVIDDDLKSELEAGGFACFGFAEGGFAYIMSPAPIRSISDVSGLKVWVPEGDQISYRIMKSFGLAPVSLPITDVMTGLQARLIEVVAASPIGALAFQWHTRIKYVTDTPLSYIYGTLVIDNRFFSKLSEPDQLLVREVMGRVYTKLNLINRKNNQEAIKAMTDQGIEFVNTPPAEKERWQNAADTLIEELGDEGEFSLPLYRKLASRLEEYRNGKVSRGDN
ncbi:MAG: C4-dicarboxylate ABC transporter [Desulfuromonas sp.]|nr:MAG: C4-dicarboxylate ABC transporter [Desulfuromonas sp.]